MADPPKEDDDVTFEKQTEVKFGSLVQWYVHLNETVTLEFV